DIGTVGVSGAQPLERRVLVSKGLQEPPRKLRRVERLLGERRYGFLNLDGVHVFPRLFRRRRGKARSQVLAAHAEWRQSQRAPLIVSNAFPCYVPDISTWTDHGAIYAAQGARPRT